MRTEDLKRTILRRFGSREFYGYDVHKLLASEKIEVGISRLYRVLNEMLSEGLLEGRWEKSKFGPEKRVYRLAEKGKKEREKTLLEAIETVHDFYGEYLLSLPPGVGIFDGITKLLTNGINSQCNVAYIAAENLAMHDRLIRSLHGGVRRGRIYLVKPNSVTVDLSLDNLMSLDGSYGNIPLRDSHLDLLVVTGVPQEDYLEPALKEWRRVLRTNGVLAILAPTDLIQKYEDPLTIGDFIERYEHETLGKGKRVDREFLQESLRKFFRKVEEKRIVHVAVFLAAEPVADRV